MKDPVESAKVKKFLGEKVTLYRQGLNNIELALAIIISIRGLFHSVPGTPRPHTCTALHTGNPSMRKFEKIIFLNKA